ncbi:1,3-beta-galactosyl-N-acetylhexosamine phosphorylase C-terminal domain-containing protein [Coprobacillus cateniformis]
MAVINNTTEALFTDLYVSGNKVETLNLLPMELRWITI